MTATFHVGDAIQVMATLPEKSVDLVLSSPPFLALRSYLPADHPLKSLEGGSQATPGAYIDWLVDVVEACARILAPHGSLCFELGDTYAGSANESALSSNEGGPGNARIQYPGMPSIPARRTASGAYTVSTKGPGWPLAKSLSLIPELFRLTLVYGTNPLTGRTTERWRLRNVIRWVRPNPPVGALGDKFRPATSELMVFCKSARRFFDLDAVREPFKYGDNGGGSGHTDDGTGEWGGTRRLPQRVMTHAGAPPLDWWNIPPGGYSGSHYAVWPAELCVKPIKAMCPEKVCRQCGEPRRRIVGEASYVLKDGTPIGNRFKEQTRKAVGVNQWDGDYSGGNQVLKVQETTGFSDCGHNNWRPGLVLDPFVGSGTTLAVATGHGRDAIGIDLDERNYALALERVGPLILQRGEVAA